MGPPDVDAEPFDPRRKCEPRRHFCTQEGAARLGGTKGGSVPNQSSPVGVRWFRTPVREILVGYLTGTACRFRYEPAAPTSVQVRPHQGTLPRPCRGPPARGRLARVAQCPLTLKIAAFRAPGGLG
jgi:hypothetical protein